LCESHHLLELYNKEIRLIASLKEYRITGIDFRKSSRGPPWGIFTSGERIRGGGIKAEVRGKRREK